MIASNSLKLRLCCGAGFIVLLVYTAGLLPFLMNCYLDVVMPLPNSPQMEEVAYEATLNTSELIAYYGYPVEEYIVQTDDGYLLAIQRIPNPNSNKKPVLIMHGMGCMSSVWIDNRNESLGFILADEGFDVWLGNLRGNVNSLRHVYITAEDPAFWNFSIDKLAFYDMPAMIDFILNKTKLDKLLLIAHSLGTTSSMGTFVVRPEYNEKVQGFIAMAPVGSVGYITSSVRLLMPMYYSLKVAAQTFGFGHVFPYTPLMTEILTHICGSAGHYWCDALYPTVSGYNPSSYNQTRIPIFATHSTSALAIDVFFHYGQMVMSKTFTFYDYMDQHKNMMKYGTPYPPAYNLSMVTVPTALFWGSNDALADPLDVALLLKKLPNVILNHRISDLLFNHYNFMWTFNIRTLLADKLIETLHRFDKMKA